MINVYLSSLIFFWHILIIYFKYLRIPAYKMLKLLVGLLICDGIYQRNSESITSF